VFGRYGYKRTSMNLIAEAAGMSRPALYQHFSGKSAVFRAVATDLADELIANSQLAAARTAASLTERLYEALAVKLEFVLDTVESGYRGELLSERAALVPEVLVELEQRHLAVIEAIVVVLERTGNSAGGGDLGCRSRAGAPRRADRHNSGQRLSAATPPPTARGGRGGRACADPRGGG
jgi:AcrR family transcriptional regulator